MAFIEKEWWKDTKWFKIFLAGCLAVILFIAGGAMLMPKPDMMSVLSNFGVEIPSDGATRLYKHNTQGWFGDGEDYSVWQYRNPDKLMNAFNWQKGQAFQSETFTVVTTKKYIDEDNKRYVDMEKPDGEKPEGYFLPRELDQEVYYYQVNDEYSVNDGQDIFIDDRLLLVFAPEVKLGDGKYYENLLFVAAWYS